MKAAKLAAIAVSGTLISGTVLFPAGAAASDPIPHLLEVRRFVIHDENFVHLSKGTYLRDAAYLFDDQDKVPEYPDNFKVADDVWKSTSRDNWTPNQQMEYGPAAFYMDLGANYVITDIAFLDTNGTPTWTVSDGEPFSWHDIAEVNMDTYNSWRLVDLEKPRSTRYLHFSSDYCDSGVAELAIYGYKDSDLTDKQKAKTAPVEKQSSKPLTAGQRAGFNAFIDDPITAMMAAGNIREYHNLSWLLDSDCKVKFTQGTWGDMDAYYTVLKKHGISAIPCFQGGSTAISGGEKAAEIPVPAGADTLDPASYAVHAQAMYQVAARYGSNTDVPPDTINITDAQEVRIGMGLLDALENSNEPNKSWAGKANYFTPYELAAMCSADYDGHEGTIPNAGVHTADPDFRLAMGGLVGYSTMIQYLDEMKLWFDYNRSDGMFAVDIINVHIGPDDYCVEDSSLEETITGLKQWIDKNAPGTELWISEFEVPMGDCETEGTDNHDNKVYQEKYAQRVARTYLTAIAAGADRITKFQLRDEGEGVYYNSGLVTGKGEWNKKQAWYALSCMTHTLKDARWTGTSGSGGVTVQIFDSSGSDVIKCAYSPTNTDKTVKGYTLSAEGRKYAYLTVPSDSAEGTSKELPVNSGKVTLDVSEDPVYVTFTDSPVTIIDNRNAMIRPVSISLDSDGSGASAKLDKEPEDKTLRQFYRMFDEPDTMPDPVYGDTSGLKTPSTDVTVSGITAYAHFDRSYVFNGFAVYDTFGTGGIEVYDAHTDKLLWSSDLGGYMYRAVTMTDDSAPTDCLKIVKKDGAMNELSLYGYPCTVPDWDADKDGRWSVFDLTLIRSSIASGSGDYTESDLTGLSNFLLGK